MRHAEPHRGSHWRAPAWIRKAFALIAAFGLLFALVAVAQAAAAEPGHALMMGDAGKCQMPAAPATHHDKASPKICCAALGAAVEKEACSQAVVEPAKSRPSAPAIASLRAGLLHEIATPPPRRS